MFIPSEVTSIKVFELHDYKSDLYVIAKSLPKFFPNFGIYLENILE